MGNYALEKTVLTHPDFVMGIHLGDCQVYAFALYEPGELVLDIDYIFERVDRHSDNARFWVAPCTLVYENVRSVNVEIEGTQPVVRKSIRYSPKKIKRQGVTGDDVDWFYNISMDKGEFSFRSAGYKLYVRRNPVLVDRKSLTFKERGDVSFERGFVNG